MVRKNRRQKNSTVQTESTHSDKSDDDTNNDGLKCKYCDVVSASIKEKQEHEQGCEAQASVNTYITSEGKLRFLCTVCDQLFKYQTGLKKHKLRHQPPGGFICSECNEHFVTDAERSIHKEVIHKIFKCLICNEKCTSEEEFLKHINDLHEGRDREYVVCADCGAQFRQKNQLRLHIESKCGTVRCHTCNQCNSKFMTQNTLNAHMQIHIGEKKHLCNYCGNSFLSRGQLKIHERSHTKEKPYKCLVCNKAFAHRESLVTHSSLHTGIKPYQCQCCGNQFSCIGNLIKHRNIRQQTCGLPQYKIMKCAPRASTKVPGSLTLKKETSVKRAYAKRKIVSVPELLSVRAELASQTELAKVEPNHEQQFDEFLILNNKPNSNACIETVNFIKSEVNENEAASSGECIEILDPTILDAPLAECTENHNTISYSIPQSGVLVLTSGNYIITSLGNNIAKKPIQIKMEPPQVEQVIILNSNDIQYAEMEVDCQEIEQVVDDKGNVEILQESTVSKNPISIDEAETDEIMNQQYLENSIQHLEIVPVDESDGLNSKTEDPFDPLVCEVCAKQFKQEKSLLKHLDLKHNIECDFISKDMFKCKYCDKQYVTEKLLSKHIPCHGASGELIHKCSCCTLYFETKEKMLEHAHKEHEDRLKCNYCHKIYKDVDCRAAHIRKMHTKTGAPQKKYTFVCAKCGKKFNSRVALSDHEQGDCGRTPIYKCNFEGCGKSLHSLGSLKIHRLIHTGDLPFSCSVNTCKKRFRTHGQVKVHERSHSGEKPFKCNQCDKAFAHRESLLTHLSLHTGVKRFGCQGCGARFSCISNLQAHRRTHQQTCGQLPLDTKAQYSFNLDDGTVLMPDNNSADTTD